MQLHSNLKTFGTASALALLLVGTTRQSFAQATPPTAPKFENVTFTSFGVVKNGLFVNTATYKANETFSLLVGQNAAINFTGIDGAGAYKIQSIVGFYELFQPVSGVGAGNNVGLSNTAGWFSPINNDHSVAGFGVADDSALALFTPTVGGPNAKGAFTFDSTNQTATSSTVTFGFRINYVGLGADTNVYQDFFTGTSFNTSSIPEPAHVQLASLLILSGGAGLFQLRRKRRQA